MAKNYELEIYKIINDSGLISELGWVDDDCFGIWLYYRDLEEFIAKMTELFGYGLFDDGRFKAVMRADGVYIDLCEMLEGNVDVEEIFDKDKYKH